MRNTYGSKLIRRSSSSSSLLIEVASSPSFGFRSSSPPPSLYVATPPPSSPPRSTDDRSRESSPLFPQTSDTLEKHDELNRDMISTDDGQGCVDGKPRLATVHTSYTTQSSLRGFFRPIPRTKRPLHPSTTVRVPSSSSPFAKISKSSVLPPSEVSTPKPVLTQLHLTHLPLLHTCRECGMSFVRGNEDEGVHRRHHTRVVAGILWDGLGAWRRKDRGQPDGGWEILRDGVAFGTGKGKGTIVVCDGSWGGTKAGPEIIEAEQRPDEKTSA